MAGGPLRARPLPSLRCGHKARKVSCCARKLAQETLRPDLALRGPHAGLNLQCQKANRTGGHLDAPQTERFTMTDTAPTTEVPDDSTGQPIGTLEHLDPAMLELGPNVRDE